MFLSHNALPYTQGTILKIKGGSIHEWLGQSLKPFLGNRNWEDNFVSLYTDSVGEGMSPNEVHSHRVVGFCLVGWSPPMSHPPPTKPLQHLMKNLYKNRPWETRNSMRWSQSHPRVFVQTGDFLDVAIYAWAPHQQQRGAVDSNLCQYAWGRLDSSLSSQMDLPEAVHSNLVVFQC